MEQIDNKPVEEMAVSSPIATPSEGGESAQPSEQNLRPPKRRRSLPGMPDPEAEVIALSPKSLLETNRYVCDICGKGFQRDQNLQLHRRGHNLPWKLKQRAPDQEVKKRVYVCPEPTCAHHDPSRALGDLTGIKKHFCRKHGERKFKCEKCNKSYAVQCDWKAHMKICGTREYPCECGTVFSRRDSYISHRSFCDALAQETARSQALTVAVDTNTPSPSPPPQPPTPSTLVLSPNLSLQSSEVPENQSGHSQHIKGTPHISTDRARGGSSTSTGGNVNWNSEAFGGIFALSGHSQKQKEAATASAAATSTVKERTKVPSSSLDLDIGNNSEEDFASVFRLTLHSGKEKETAPAGESNLNIGNDIDEDFASVFRLTLHSGKEKETAPAAATVTTQQRGSSSGNGNSRSEAFAGVFAQPMPVAMHSQPPAVSYSDFFCVPTGSAHPVMEPMSLSLSTPPVYPSATLFLPSSYDNHQKCSSSSQPVLSATALLQKAAQIGSSSSSGSFIQGLGLTMSSGHDLRDDISASPAQWDCHANIETKQIISSELGLALPQSMIEPSPAVMFSSNPPTFDFLGSNNPPTLDFLGVGQGANQTPSTEYPALLNAMNGATQFGMASSSFGGMLGDPWDDHADQKPRFL